MKRWIAILMIACMLCSLFSMNVFAGKTEDSFQVTAVSSGVGDNSIRFVVPVSEFPMKVTENSLAGYKVTAELVNLSDANVKYNLDSTILTNEMRDGGRTVLAVRATEAAPVRPKGELTYNNYTLQLTISKPEPEKLPDPPAGYTGAPTVFVKAQDFKEHPGTWNIAAPEVGAVLEILKSNASSLQSAKSAQVNIYVPKDGTYKVYARARDYAAFVSSNGSIVESGTRFFHIAVGGTRFDTVIGDHGESRFAWEEVGSVTLKEGRTAIEVFDTSAFYGRLEGIILTTNDNFPLPETAEEIKKVSETYAAWVLPYVATDFETKTESPNTTAEAKPVEFKEGYNYYVYTPETFKNSLGSWKIVNQDTKNSVLPNIMMGNNDNKDSTSNPATAKFGIPKDGFYKVMVHTRDFSSSPNTRLFKVKAGENPEIVFGALGKDAWGWQESAVLPFTSGEKELKVIDYKGYNARLDMIIITDDPYFEVQDSAENFKLLSEKRYVEGSVTKQKQDNAGRPADEIAVKLNGEYMQFDVPPILENDRTLVPFRAIFEALGCDVEWDDDNQTAIGIRNGKTIMLPIGDAMAKIDNEGMFMDQPAIVVNDRTMVPLRFVSEALGANVEWIDETNTVVIMARVTPRTYWFVPSSFEELGTWTFETSTSGAFDGKALRGMHPNVGNPTPKDADPSKTKPAKVTFNAPESGTYTLWARSKDFEYNQQGTRKFQIEINGKRADKEFGTHGNTGFAWACAGEVSVKAGENELLLVDTSAFGARCDAVLLTQDANYIPPESMSSMYAIASPFNPTSGKSAGFPQYAKEQAEPTGEIVLENEDVKVVFYSVPTAKGTVIQNEIYAKQNGEFILTKERKEELGYVVISAENAQEMAPSEDKYTFSTQFNEEGIGRLYAGNDLYASGLKSWFVPIGMEKISDNQVKLTFEDKDETSLEVIWSLDEKTKTPLVTMNMVANKDGFFTMGGWEGSEMAYDDFSFALAPYRVQGKRIHGEKCLLTEQYLFTPMGVYTTTKNGIKVTKGVVIEPSFIPLRWVYSDNGMFGINMKGVYGNYRASAFAPVLGTEDSKMNAGDSYTFRYRIVSTAGDWFDTYKYVAQELFDVCDYRENVGTSLTTAIFNARKLMLDDLYGGWDANNMEHYNMEGMNVTSQGNPMYAMQYYLLTEDENVLTRRAIPTIASTLTRGDIHFNSSDRKGGLSYWSFKELPMPIGQPIAGFNSNVYGGMYEMTRGMVPYLHEYALEKGTSEVTNSYGSIASFSNLLNMYKYTGDKTYLDKAVADADKYLEEVVYATPTSMIGWSSFINISYFPNLASLIDIYEATKEQRFLDAAEEVAHYLATTLWVPGQDGEKKNSNVLANDINEIIKWNGDSDRDGNDSFWAGDKRFRVGRNGEHFSDLSSNVNITALTGEVPSWIPSRVGLGLEQSSTFQGASGHITMNTWAGDLMRLSLYTGDKYYETLARNVIIGRFSNYPGYKLTGFTTYQQTEQYPMEGPDYTNIYAHHIPPFLAMLEDFLINQTLLWSDGNIEFPSLRQQGYAYFNSNQYGHEAGKFYDEDNMWAWLDEGIVETGDIQVDFMAAKKDGVVGIAFMNESKQDVTTTVSLGEKIGAYTGSASLYDKTGNIGTVAFTDGKAELTIPARALKAVIIKTDTVKAPAFSEVKYSATNAEVENTVSTHTNGKGYILQMSPDEYYAYVYVTDKPNATKSVTLSYSIGGETMTMTDNKYPYEFIVKVDDSTKAFNYTLSSELLSGESVSGGSGTLKPIN